VGAVDIKPHEHKSTNRWYVIAPAGFNGNQDRQFIYFQKKGGAVEKAREINHWRHQRKAPKFDGSVSVTEGETTIVAVLREYDIRDAKTVLLMIDHWRKTGAGSLTVMTITEAVKKYMGYVEQNRQLRPATLADLKGKYNAVAEYFDGSKANDISSADLAEYLDEFATPSTRKQVYKKLCQLFDWLLKQRIVGIDPMLALEAPKLGAVTETEIYTVTDLQKLLRSVDSQHKELLPFISIQAYGFCRASEVARLDWSDINLATHTLIVRKEISKTHKRRVIEICDALTHWLAPYEKSTGPVAPTINGNVTKAFTDAGLTRAHNALRHSCLSYCVNLHGEEKGLAKIFKQAGHGASISAKHYIEAMTPDEAKGYYDIKRES
jgi:integrase